MFSRRIVILVLSLSVLFSSVSVAASNPNGTKCSKLNSILKVGKNTYKCTLSKGKLTWKIVPQVIATSVDSQVLVNSIATEANNQFNLQLANIKTTSPNLEFHVDPSMNPKLVAYIKAESILSANFWANLLDPNRKVVVYMASTEHFQYFKDALEPTLTPQGLEGNWLDFKLAQAKREPNGFFGGGAPANDKNNNPVFMIYAPNGISMGLGFWTQTVSHEYTHIVQRNLMLYGDMAPMFEWQKEGQADFIGAQFAAKNNVKAFASYWIQLIYQMASNTTLTNVLDWKSSQFEEWFKSKEITLDPEHQGDVPIENYVLGAMAMQYLYGTYGYEKVNDLFVQLGGIVKDCGNGDITVYKNCPAARNAIFEKVFGISYRIIYPKISDFIVDEIQWAKKNVATYPRDLLQISAPK